MIRSAARHRALRTLPDYATGPIYLSLGYGQSRSDNRAEGTNVCYAPTITQANTRALMLNNPRAPGHFFEGLFDPATATNLITFSDCLAGAPNQSAPLGQSLGSMMWWLDADDGTLGRRRKTRGYIAAGEGGRTIAQLAKGAAPWTGGSGSPLVNITGAANNGSGAIRLTVSDTSSFVTGFKTLVASVGGTTEANGTWPVTVVDATHLDLQGSTFTHAYTSGGTVGGFVIWDRMIALVTRFVQFASVYYGRSVIIENVFFLQGEAEVAAGTTQVAYQAAFTQIISDLRTDLAAITGQSTPFELFFDQTPTGGGTSGVAGLAGAAPFSQLATALANADGHTWFVGPSYWQNFGSTAHMKVDDVVLLAERFGKAASDLQQGTNPDFLYISGVSVVGSRITITCHVPQGPLVEDLTIRQDANKGFVLTAPGGATITAVTVNASTIYVDFTGSLGVGATIECGATGPGNGPSYPDNAGAVCTVRDSRADASRLVPGRFMRNFLATDRRTIS